MSEDSFWIERAQTAEASLASLKAGIDDIRADARCILETFCARKNKDGSFDIDFEKFIKSIGEESSLSLGEIINDRYKSQKLSG